MRNYEPLNKENYLLNNNFVHLGTPTATPSSVNTIEVLQNVVKNLREQQSIQFFDCKTHSVEIEVQGRKHIVDLQFSKDPELLQQYYKVRQNVYVKDRVFKNYNGAESEFDKKGDILIAKIGDKVIGGARLGLSSRGLTCNESLDHDFTYKNISKSLGIILPQSKYVEVSALIIEKEFRTRKLVPAIFKVLIERSKSFGAKYAFGTSEIHCNRSHGLALKKLKYKYELLSNIVAPTKKSLNYVEMSPMIIYLNN